jgi:hypothetical protein
VHLIAEPRETVPNRGGRSESTEPEEIDHETAQPPGNPEARLMAAELYVPHVGAHRFGEQAPRYIVQMRVPPATNAGSPLVALSDFTYDRRVARAWLFEVREQAGTFLREQRRHPPIPRPPRRRS